MHWLQIVLDHIGRDGPPKRVARILIEAEVNAAEDARDKLLAMAREVGLSAETTPIPDIFKKKFGMLAGNIVGVGSFMPSYQSPDANGQTENATP